MRRQRNQIFLSPGLAPLHERVRRACARQTINPRGTVFTKTYRRIEAGLQGLLGTGQEVLRVPGNGTQAMELAAANTVRPGDRVLVVSQGEFGDRFAAILRAYGADVVVLRGLVGEPLSPGALLSVLKDAGPVRAVFLTHVETSVGVLAP